MSATGAAAGTVPDMFASAVAGPVPARTTWVVADARGLAGGYWYESERHPVDTAAEADLISSQTTTRLHAPQLDLDDPAVLGLDPTGGFVLWADRLGPDGHRACVTALAAAGLGPGPDVVDARAGFTVASSTPARRAALLGSPGWDLVDTGEMTGLLRTVGPTWDGTWADLVCAATAAVHVGAPRGVRTSPQATAGGDGLVDPWPVLLTVPATMVASTRHQHLYLDAEVSAEVFFTLLDRLAAGGMVERGYAVASRARDRAYLRPPWVRKAEPADVVA